ncbi:hypothetical protein [Oerskovia sp. USHLN155]|uniref:hypothetical protein n=1 Tax=Oerskovia sp. USHLN155 TaxID=3081288 RepID=UPI003017E221
MRRPGTHVTVHCRLVGDAWTRATGRDDEDYYEARETAAPPAAEPDTDGGGTPVGASTRPAGESWDFDDEDENRRRLPRLAALFS